MLEGLLLLQDAPIWVQRISSIHRVYGIQGDLSLSICWVCHLHGSDSIARFDKVWSNDGHSTSKLHVHWDYVI